MHINEGSSVDLKKKKPAAWRGAKASLPGRGKAAVENVSLGIFRELGTRKEGEKKNLGTLY